MHTLADYLAATDPAAARAIERALAAANAAANAWQAEIARQHAHLIELF